MKLQQTLFNFRKLQTNKLHNFRSFQCRQSTTDILHKVPPSVIYNRLVSEGRVREDIHQIKALHHLDRLYNELIPYIQRNGNQLGESKSRGISQVFGSIFGIKYPLSSAAFVPKSFYFW